ncbi:MAG: hypothetical protein Q7V58_09425 [Actinomycetota bacterium]|nr:hypothetical protein [Actinomycetota bacterium]
MTQSYTPPGKTRVYEVPEYTLADGPVNFEEYSDALDDLLDTKCDVAPSQSVKTADATFALTDATGGKSVVANKATAIVFTIPPQASVAFGSAAELHWFNKNDGVLTIAPGAGVTFIGTALTFAKGTGGKAVRTASDEWVVLPFLGGASAAALSGTTGSPATSSITGYALTKWTGNGSFTVSVAGLATFLVQAGAGGGSSSRSGGAGGQIWVTVWLEPGTYTVVVGAGGAAATGGGCSQVGLIGLTAIGGGALTPGATGFWGSAAGTFTNNVPGQGYPSDGANYGAGGAGGPGVGDTGGPGVVWLDGNTYGVGGSKATGGAGAANTGNGGEGNTNDAGGSGVVILAQAA